MENYICHECGIRLGRPYEGSHTARLTECDWCGKKEHCLPSRHYGITVSKI